MASRTKTQPAIQIRPKRDTRYHLRDMIVPPMFRGAVELTVRRCGECPTANAVKAGRYGAAPPGQEWLTLGHEILAEISAMDDNVSRPLRLGQRVMVSVRFAGPNARGLAKTHPHLCSDSSMGWYEHGLWGAHGGYTEKMVVDASLVHPVPDDLSDSVAVLAEGGVCVQTAVIRGIDHQQASLKGAQWPHPWIALVIGAGPAALMATMFYKMMGFTVVVVSRKDENDPKAVRLRKLGAFYIKNENTPGFMQAVAKEYGPFAQIFNASGVAEGRLWRSVVADTGSFVEYSIPEHSCPMSVDMSEMMIKEVTTASCSVGSINCDPANWKPTFTALQWTLDRNPWLTEGLFFEVPFDSKAPKAILGAVDDGWFKPMVVMKK